MWNEDIKAQRFYLDFMNCGFETCFMNTIYNFYKMHDRQYHLKIDRMSGELSMLATAASFGYFSLQYAFFTGKLDCKTYEQFSDYAIRMQFRFMNFTEDEIDEIMDRGTQVYNMLDINIEPYFTIS